MDLHIQFVAVDAAGMRNVGARLASEQGFEVESIADFDLDSRLHVEVKLQMMLQHSHEELEAELDIRMPFAAAAFASVVVVLLCAAGLPHVVAKRSDELKANSSLQSRLIYKVNKVSSQSTRGR